MGEADVPIILNTYMMFALITPLNVGDQMYLIS